MRPKLACPVRDDGVWVDGDTSGVAGQLFECEDLVRSIKQLLCSCLRFSDRARVAVTKVVIRCCAEPLSSLQKLQKPLEVVFVIPYCGSRAAFRPEGVCAEKPVRSRIAASCKEDDFNLQLSGVVEKHNFGIINRPDAISASRIGILNKIVARLLSCCSACFRD